LIEQLHARREALAMASNDWRTWRTSRGPGERWRSFVRSTGAGATPTDRDVVGPDRCLESLRAELLRAERRAVVRLRDEGAISDEVLYGRSASRSEAIRRALGGTLAAGAAAGIWFPGGRGRVVPSGSRSSRSSRSTSMVITPSGESTKTSANRHHLTSSQM
jgi:hypothetical protein